MDTSKGIKSELSAYSDICFSSQTEYAEIDDMQTCSIGPETLADYEQRPLPEVPSMQLIQTKHSALVESDQSDDPYKITTILNQNDNLLITQKSLPVAPNGSLPPSPAPPRPMIPEYSINKHSLQDDDYKTFTIITQKPTIGAKVGGSVTSCFSNRRNMLIVVGLAIVLLVTVSAGVPIALYFGKQTGNLPEHLTSTTLSSSSKIPSSPSAPTTTHSASTATILTSTITTSSTASLSTKAPTTTSSSLPLIPVMSSTTTTSSTSSLPTMASTTTSSSTASLPTMAPTTISSSTASLPAKASTTTSSSTASLPTKASTTTASSTAQLPTKASTTTSSSTASLPAKTSTTTSSSTPSTTQTQITTEAPTTDIPTFNPPPSTLTTENPEVFPSECTVGYRCNFCYCLSGRCPANGDTYKLVEFGQIQNCSLPCYSFYSGGFDGGKIHRGCIETKPGWEEASKTPGCRVIDDYTVCFCCGDLCNTDDMRKYMNVTPDQCYLTRP